jgi:dTMP kinase
MFIVLEGIDGSGKTILINILNKKIPNSIVLKENTDFVAKMNENPKKAVEIFEEFCIKRVEFSKQIQEYLDLGKTVLMDRYYPSSFCYQLKLCKDMGFDCNGIVNVYNKYYPQWLKPDVIFVMDTDLEICIERIKSRGEPVEEDILKKAKSCYESLSSLFDNVYYIRNENDAFSIIKLFQNGLII